MSKYIYKKSSYKHRKYLKLLGLAFFLTGAAVAFYIFLPLITWQVYFMPAFASENILAPVPKTTLVNPSNFGSLVSYAQGRIKGVDYTDAQNWFPSAEGQEKNRPDIAFYSLSIPRLEIKNATVSTKDNNLRKHLVHYSGTNLPPEKGNAVIFGHSTLPALFKPNDYKTIFANLHTLEKGDEIKININNVLYSYKIENIIIVDPDEASVFEQPQDDSYLTLVTCTPPGTTWKRLVIKARLQRIT